MSLAGCGVQPCGWRGSGSAVQAVARCLKGHFYILTPILGCGPPGSAPKLSRERASEERSEELRVRALTGLGAEAAEVAAPTPAPARPAR